MPLPALLLSLVPSLIDKAVGILDRKFPTRAEQDLAKARLETELSLQLQAVWDEEQKQLTTRHQNDMLSDSWLSKNIRPMTLIYLMGLFTVAFFMEVPQKIIELLRDLLMTAFVFYFGSRTFEKITAAIKGGR